MLQRSPTYMVAASKYGKLAAIVRKLLPRMASHLVIRMYTALTEAVFVFLCRVAPRLVKQQLRRKALKNLPDGYDVDTHFKPPYQPWDQRLCLMVGADVYRAISAGDLDVVTDHIDHVDASGVVLRSGRRVDADVIITAAVAIASNIKRTSSSSRFPPAAGAMTTFPSRPATSRTSVSIISA